MGKKNRKSKASENSELGLPRNVRRETLEIINVLLEKCSSPFGSVQTEWADFMEVHGLVEKLRKKQQNYLIARNPRDEHFTEFMEWLKTNRVETDSVDIAEFPVGGYGLKAKQDFKAGDMFLAIPRSVMMTTDTAKKSVLGSLIVENRILQSMSNISLALHVLCELCTPTSFWLPYLKILPESYTTPLYFKPEELQLLRASPTMSETINQFRNITRQYAYFFNLFQGHDIATKLPIQLKNLCFDDYRWAVSTVMTRQNQIPTADGLQMLTALIPLWDMCNHTNGIITTNFNLDKDCSECCSLGHVVPGDQVFIFYGSRSNAELFIHNGFVYPKNQSDRLTVKLGIGKNDPLYSMKSEVLARLSLLPSRLYSLHCGMNPIDSDTLGYLRVFAMTDDDLKKALSSREEISKLRDFDEIVSVANEEKAWSFLATRTQLLLKSYSTTAEDDSLMLQGDTLGPHSRMAIQLRLCEKNILKIAHEYAIQMRDTAEERAKSAPLRPTVDDDLDELEAELNLNGVNETGKTEIKTPPELPLKQKTLECNDVDAEVDQIKLAEL